LGPPSITSIIEIDYATLSNEALGKVLFTSEKDVFEGHFTLPKHEIVDCGAFCEVIFFCISPRNLFGAFFYRLNARTKPPSTKPIDGRATHGRLK